MKKSLDEMYMDEFVDISKINNAKIQEKVFLALPINILIYFSLVNICK